MQAAARQLSGTEAPTVFWLSEYGGTYGGIGRSGPSTTIAATGAGVRVEYTRSSATGPGS